MGKLTNIEACVFDAYGTLFDVISSARQCADDLGDIWINFSALWRKKQLEYAWLRSLMGTYTDFWHITGDALDYTMETFNVHNPLLRAKLMSLYLRLKPYPEVQHILEELKDRKFRLAILSNGSRTMLYSALRHSRLHSLFDNVFSIDDVGVYKPSSDAYRLCTTQLDLAPNQISYQSANPWDTAGASVFGFNVVWINRINQKTEKLGPESTGAIEVRSLNTLPDLIE